MDEVVAALLAIPTILLGILVMVSTVEGADRRGQLLTVAHRAATAAAIAVPSDATPGDARAGVAAGSAAARAASTVCIDTPSVTVDYHDERSGQWMDPASYQSNTWWAGNTPKLNGVRVSVTCTPLPGPLPALASRVSHTSRKPLAGSPPAVKEAPPANPVNDQLQAQR